jgi:uncharacterized protein YjbI with pentapeptide repeats
MRVDRSIRVVVMLAIAAVAIAAGAWLVLVEAPLWLASSLPGVARLTEREYTEVVAEARTALLQVIGGLAVAGGLIFTAIQVRQRRAEQSASLFLNAIEKLADERPEAQLYAIQGMDRVAELSAADRKAVERILAQFVRRRAREWNIAQGERKRPGRPLGKTSAQRLSDAPFQAALETLGRRRRSTRAEALDLEGLVLSQPHLDGLDFGRVCMRNAQLLDGHFNGVSFARSSLRNARLYGELRDADFRAADLRGAEITAFEGFTDGVRFDRAWYNEGTRVAPVALAERLRQSGVENNAPMPLIEGCR